VPGVTPISSPRLHIPLPASKCATPPIHHVDCAVGAHIGPLGGCILGNDNPPPVVVERRAADAPDAHDADSCGTKSVTRTDGTGNSETKTKTNANFNKVARGTLASGVRSLSKRCLTYRSCVAPRRSNVCAAFSGLLDRLSA
jgi:hypothetical protein